MSRFFDRPRLYLIGSPWNTLVKIGYSGRPPRRLATFATSCPFPLVLLWQSEDEVPCDSEAYVFGLCGDFHIYGEWYDFRGVDPVAHIKAILEARPKGSPVVSFRHKGRYDRRSAADLQAQVDALRASQIGAAR